MKTIHLLVSIGKLLLSGLAYFIGLVLGGVIATLLRLPQPPMPEGADQTVVLTCMMLVSPVLALALALIAQGIAGRWLARTLILSGFTWIAYTLNTVLEASVFMAAYASTSASTAVSFLVPSLFCGGAVAALFPPKEKGQSFVAAWRAFFSRRGPGEWLWRLLLAGVAFIPIYTSTPVRQRPRDRQ